MPRILIVHTPERELKHVKGMAVSRSGIEEVTTWESMRLRLRRSPRPTRLIVSSAMLDSLGMRLLQGLFDKASVPTTIYAFRARAIQLVRAGQMKHMGAEVVLEGDLKRLREILIAPEFEPVEFLLDELNARRGFSEQVVRRSADLDPNVKDPVGVLSRSMGIGRTSFYQRFAETDLPKPTQIVALFRLLPAIELLRAGDKSAAVAFRVNVHDHSALRRSILRRFGLSMREVRNLKHPREAILAWVNHQKKRSKRSQP